MKKVKLELDVHKTKLMYREVEQNMPEHSSARSKSKKNEDRSLSPEPQRSKKGRCSAFTCCLKGNSECRFD